MDKLSFEKRALVYGLLTTVSLIALFFLMKVLNLIHIYELRALNGFIMFTGVYLAIRSFKRQSDKQFHYLGGMGIGLLTSLVTTITFSVFVLGYLLTDSAFMQALKAEEPHGIYINEWGATIIIFIEAAASGFIFSFLSMQWLKKEENIPNLPKKSKYKYSH